MVQSNSMGACVFNFKTFTVFFCKSRELFGRSEALCGLRFAILLKGHRPQSLLLEAPLSNSVVSRWDPLHVEWGYLLSPLEYPRLHALHSSDHAPRLPSFLSLSGDRSNIFPSYRMLPFIQQSPSGSQACRVMATQSLNQENPKITQILFIWNCVWVNRFTRNGWSGRGLAPPAPRTSCAVDPWADPR